MEATHNENDIPEIWRLASSIQAPPPRPTPTEAEVQDQREWLNQYFAEKAPKPFTAAESDAVELDRR